MRSPIIEKLLNETPQHIKDEVAEYTNKILKEMEKPKKLPQINVRRDESMSHQGALQVLLYKTIEKYKEEVGYQFETYEIDSVLLKLIQRHHESYINMKFGEEM